MYSGFHMKDSDKKVINDMSDDDLEKEIDEIKKTRSNRKNW